MKPYYEDDAAQIYHGDCLEVLPGIGQVDHVITDPPFSRMTYNRLLGHNTHAGSRTPDRLYKGGSMAKLAALEIGCVDELVVPVAIRIAKLVRRWALVFCDAETLHRWQEALELVGMRGLALG